MNDVLTPEEACTYLRVSRQTLNRWSDIGKLKRIRLSDTTFRYLRRDIEAFVDHDVS